MPRKGSKTEVADLSELRARAQALVGRHPTQLQERSLEEVQQLIHELEVHRVELQMQNEALREAQQKLEASRDRYVDLYDFAPVGYVTLDEGGLIRQINLTAARLLGTERARLIGHSFTAYLAKGHKRQFRSHLRECAAGMSQASCEVLLCPKAGRPVPAKLDTVRALDDEDTLYQTAINDITDRMRAEEAVRESEEDLNRAQAVSHTGSWRLNVRQDALTWSDECHRISGIPKGTPLTYETFLSVVHPDDREYVDRTWNAALSGEPYDIEHRFLVGDTVKWVRQKAELEFDEKGELLGGFGTCQDVTQLKQADEALRRLSQFPEENPNAVLRVAADETLMYANEPARNWLDTLSWRADAPLPAPVLAVVSQARGQARAIGGEISNSAGATMWLSVVQPPGEDYVNIYGRDITERKQAEQALKQLNETLEQRVQERTAELAESETRFRTIFEEASDGIILADPETKAFHAANRAACKMIGYSEEKMCSIGVADIHTKEDLLQVSGTFEKLARGEFSLAKDIPLKRSDGTVLYADVNAFRLVLGGKQYLAGIFRDATERKDLEREISAAAMHEQQLIGQELHDGLGQQLLGLGLMARSLQKTLENKNATEAEVAGELVQVVKDAHDHVRAMIKGVRPVDVQAGGLLAALTDLAAATERLAGLPCDFECRQLFALEDDHAATQLFYIAQEAVRNSVKHARAKHITIGFGREDRRLRLWVHDDGRGLPAGSDRTDGMGFRIVRYRAALIGATLAIEPAHGGGTLVTCTLPLEQLR